MRIVKLGNYIIHLTDEVFLLMSKYIQYQYQQHEAGGILLGQVKKQNIYITRITFPSINDKSSRHSFNRNKNKAQSIIDYEFYNSSKRTIYLGEWHTHPEKFPIPSITDKKMIEDQLLNNKLNEPFILQMILGTKGYYMALLEQNKTIEIKDKY